MFLAHGNGAKRADIGFIFGYFTLGGVGVPPGPDSSDDGGEGKPPEEDDGGASPPGGRGTPGNDRYRISTKQIKAEPKRICGVRYGGAAVYIVDALARDIDLRFGAVLEESEAAHEARHDSSWADREFENAVREVGGDRDPVTSIPAELADFARRHGELVVFDRPYPSFRRRPRAAFRHLARVDGDELLRRIVAAYKRGGKDRTIRIPYYRATPNKKKTKAQFVAELAEESETSMSCASDFWGALTERIMQELGEGRPMTLTNVGTFRVKRIQGSDQISFEPSAVLKRELRVE